MKNYSDNQLIAFTLSSYKNYIETGDFVLSREDLSNTNQAHKIKKLSQDQEKICNRLSDLKNCFLEE